MNKTVPSTSAGDAASRAHCWRFGGVVLDGRSLELTVDGQQVKLEPKPMEMLLYLLRHPGEVVTKDELLDNLWAGRFLSESVLTKTMAKLRQGLHDEEQVLIKTVHGFGYRLAAPLTVEVVGPMVSAPQLHFAAGDPIPLRPNWQLTQQLGSGGLGEAWLATQTKTGEQRVFKFALDAHRLTALKREITLFRVLHDTYGDRPDIVRLLDWNIDEAPFFTEAEYANGGSLPQWAATQGGLHSVPLAQRLELVAQAADALAAAHAAGVLHKDLKPANLLVHTDAEGHPHIRLADFGSGRMVDLARLEQLEITRLGFTQIGEAVDEGSDSSGTPFYFAPELMAGQQPTAQTDIYALGVLLYQMVVADLKRPLAPGWEREIDDALLREDIAQTASSQVTLRLGDAAALARRLRSLDARRVEARQRADRLAAQAQQRLREARLRVTRRWSLALAAVFAFAALGIGLMYLNAEGERRRAEAINTFVNQDLFTAANPWESMKADVTVREMLDQAREKASTRFAEQPDVQAGLRMTLGRSYMGIGNFPAAIAEFQKALALLGNDARAITKLAVETRMRIGESATNNNDKTLAAATLGALVEDLERAHGQDDPAAIEARVRLIELEYTAGREQQALDAMDAIEPRARKVLGAEHVMTLSILNMRGWSLILLSRPAEAEPYFREAYETRLRTLPANHPDTLGSLQGLANVAKSLGHLDEAEKRYQQLIDARRSVLGPEHPLTLTALNQMHAVYDAQGRHADNERMMREVVAVRTRVSGPNNSSTTIALNNLATTLSRLGKLTEAETLYRQVMEQDRIASPDDPSNLITINYLADVLRRQGRLDAALALHREVLDTAARQLAEDRVERGIYRLYYAYTLFDLGRRAEAATEVAAAAPLLTKGLPAGHRHRQMLEAMQTQLAGAAAAAK
ncbi:MAG: tetratricopeptide repeat protein [Stagnimonas sp.]|nr:tetratricopeptide repeat protein [Stagnimonas sp.]